MPAPFIRDNMNGYQIASIIDAICEIPHAERSDVVKHARPFIHNTMNSKEIASIIDAAREIPAKDVLML
ncbi:MAG: hypothetical protein H6925_05005 [Holosporaceae bacterium]|nr:MAG: hypothetical protein H6925_05005 [Holosporaceae bacterium]